VHPATPAVGPHPADTSPDWVPPTVPRFVSPVLVLIAAVSILEGYKWLNVVSTGGWQPSAAVFVSFAVPLAVVLARPRRDRRRVVAARALVAVSLIMLTVTVLALLVDRPPVTHLMGGSDLLFAVTALGVALANEWALGWRPKAGGTVPDRPPDQGPPVTVG
jgi:peptidoglycan/LPS O-acetylase OafA/YrhL